MVNLSAPAGGIVERDYNTWEYRWAWRPTVGLNYNKGSFFIDDKNEMFYLWWEQNVGASCSRFGAYNLNDHSTIFESSSSIYYTRNHAIPGIKSENFYIGACELIYGGMSRSLQTYLLLCRDDLETIEVWRNGVKLWSHKINVDTGEDLENPYIGTISSTGKYILVYAHSNKDLVLYEGV